MRKVAIVTSTRAEYGLLRKLIGLVHSSQEFELQLFVTGSHLDQRSGFTADEIAKDGFPVRESVKILSEDDSKLGMARGLSRATELFAESFEKAQPDLVVVLGDRFEILGVVQAAFLLGLPVAHIHGGEVTTHAIDDSIRHAITKLAYFHFTAAEIYRNRVIQLGEEPERVFNVGAPGLDNIRSLQLLSADELESDIGFRVDEQTLLITYHPETLSAEAGSRADIDIFLDALSALKGLRFLITAPNIDAGGRAILTRLEEFCSAQAATSRLVASLGVVRYLSAMKLAGAVVGNSSSGIIEAPFMQTPTVNIGGRQDGRLRADSVIDCSVGKDAIVKAIQSALALKSSAEIKKVVSPFGVGTASQRIFEILSQRDWPKAAAKKFYDLEVSR